jgi:hypothetical protein
MTMDDRARITDMRRTFAAPPELLRSRPRDVSLTAGGKALYGVSILLFAAAFIAGLAVHSVATRQAEHWRAFDRDGASVSGEVVRLWRGSGDPKPYWVAYGFDVSGLRYQGQSRLRSAAWRSLETGSEIAVLYLPEDPNQNMAASAERRQLPAWLAFLLAAALGGGGVLCLVVLNDQRRLLMEGRAAPALVTAVVTHKTSHGGSHRQLKYTFPLLSGAIATGKSEAPRKPPGAGTVICIVYDPDRPARSRPYPFPLIRVGDGSHVHSFSTGRGQASGARRA